MFDGRTECIECNAPRFRRTLQRRWSLVHGAHAPAFTPVFGGELGENLCAAIGGSKERASEFNPEKCDRAGGYHLVVERMG